MTSEVSRVSNELFYCATDQGSVPIMNQSTKRCLIFKRFKIVQNPLFLGLLLTTVS